MKEKYGGIDVLINNAAIAFTSDSAEPLAVQAEVTCRTNYWSTKNACDILFPILKPGKYTESGAMVQNHGCHHYTLFCSRCKSGECFKRGWAPEQRYWDARK